MENSHFKMLIIFNSMTILLYFWSNKCSLTELKVNVCFSNLVSLFTLAPPMKMIKKSQNFASRQAAHELKLSMLLEQHPF